LGWGDRQDNKGPDITHLAEVEGRDDADAALRCDTAADTSREPLGRLFARALQLRQDRQPLLAALH
jgi:hypothetical protein